MAKPRLLFISSFFPDTREPYRGLDNATLLHHLSDRWDVAVMAARPILPFGRKGWQAPSEDALFSPRYVPVHYIPKIGHTRNHRLMASSLSRSVGELRGAFQVALSAWSFPDSCAVALLAAQFRFPFFSIVHGLDIHEDFRIRGRREIVLESLGKARGVFTRSAVAARKLTEAGMDPGLVHPVLNGVDPARVINADIAEVRQELGLPVNQRIVLFVGDFVANKNPVLLVEAFERVCDDDRFANALLVLVGAGPLEGEIHFHAERGPYASRVLIAGRQSPATVAKFMRAADVLCVPSNEDGAPNVILEAFASGVPVVATDVGGIPELHTGEHLGRLVPPRDAVAMAAALKVCLDLLPARARIQEHAGRFTWKQTADQYHAVLAKAGGADAPGPRQGA